MTEPPMIEAVDRAIRLLVALADTGPEGAGVTDLADNVGINKSTAYRALGTLRAHAFAIQSESTGRYRLGPAAIALGERFWGSQNVSIAMHPALLALSREVGELVHLGVLVDDHVLYVDKVEPERAIRVWSTVGAKSPAATTSMGRALLAARDLSDDQLRAYLRAVPAERQMNWEHLRDVVHEARERGYATEVEENELGVACIGMAILNGSHAVGALSITSLAERMTPERLDVLATAIRTVVSPLLPDGLHLFTPSTITPQVGAGDASGAGDALHLVASA